MSSERTHRPTADLEAYESLVLRSLGLTAETAPVERWAQVYADVSAKLTTEPQSGPTGLTKTKFDAEDVSAVWGLVYGARTFEVATRIFAERAPSAGGFVELGAGWGSGALAAALAGHSVGEIRLVDLSQERLLRAQRLFETAKHTRPSVSVVDARGELGLEVGSSICLPYSFGEMFPESDPSAAAKWLIRSLRRIGPEGRIFIFEPGSRVSARRLQATRDAILGEAEVLGPCTGADLCPLLEEDSEWCHFTWPFRPGPITRALMEAGGRRWQELHGSWLVLGLRGSAPNAEVVQPLEIIDRGCERVRVLETRAEGRTKVRMRVCAREGIVKLTALCRTADFQARIGTLKSGALVELELGKLTVKGDGLRLDADTPLTVVT